MACALGKGHRHTEHIDTPNTPNTSTAPAAQRPQEAAPFIDLGALGSTASATGFDIRLALPGGIVLTISAR
jgi:hypothetical protein